MRYICMLHMFHLNIAKVDLVLHILQWLYTCVVSLCFKRMLRVFHLDVAYVAVAINVCCKLFSKCFNYFYLDVA
jgi:hypothetical protein